MGNVDGSKQVYETQYIVLYLSYLSKRKEVNLMSYHDPS